MLSVAFLDLMKKKLEMNPTMTEDADDLIAQWKKRSGHPSKLSVATLDLGCARFASFFVSLFRFLKRNAIRFALHVFACFRLKLFASV